ncbi:ABC transporter ATP-binding protein [Syntrophorhabdus aromaticivorans]|uniref:ATP-binding cassette domain-containing protein n=1 Tax=Syntrophorhabdus aromaticivorans TaxID=328301 RepID=A0A351U1J8_9BACT|nr:ATP-binding cassette domain-containing protein [Syntrophorhabdus aromaticivorans]NLW35910.1 ATP-binding cassette domain-containing protein [Syntrophorhabdus aromaticivorans]HBA53829.1 ABC transporter ATP-binding protein [Syntrophorhabdus aromaticivorans]
MSSSFFAVDRLGKVFAGPKGPKTVLRNISFSLSDWDSLAIMGPSGCGKTTLLLIVAGLLPPTEGTARLEGEAIDRPSRKVGLVLQEYGLFPWKTAGANILLGARLQRMKIPEKKVAELKSTLGIEGLDHLYPHQLSGGQRQRVALARALLLRPSLLLLDEPFAAIDAITRERLQNRLLTVFGQRRFSFIIVTHSIEEAVFLGRTILVLDNGTAGIKTMIDNPLVGDLHYRSKPEFFEYGNKLRAILEDME